MDVARRPPAAARRAAPWAAPGFGLPAVLALLAVWALVQVGDGLTAPFINDDYIFLDKMRHATLAAVWAPRDLLFHYYRPWSRELHFGLIQQLFGARELPFHVASLALWLAVMGAWFAFVRRVAGVRVAAVATAGIAALGAWNVPLRWASGAQDLWMLLFALLALRAAVDDRRAWTAVALAFALISKETAVVLPAIVLDWHVIVRRERVGEALRRTALLWGVVVVWAALHPLGGGRMMHPIHDLPEPGVHPAAMTIAGQSLLALINLVPWPDPERGWGAALVRALPGVALLAALVLWGLARRETPRAEAASRPADAGLVRFGLLWAVIGALPLALPTIAWRSHYLLFAALGAWLAIAVILARRPAAAVAVVAALALLRTAGGDTVSQDWSSEWYRKRAAEFMQVLRADLLRKLPAPGDHARLYFVRVPSHVGFIAGDAPALRVWYGDSTLRGGFYTDFAPRRPGARPGPDYFFRFDSTLGWVPVRSGAEDIDAARRENPRWEADHVMLATTLAKAGAWKSAASEYAKLAEAAPASVEYAYDAAVSFESLGDSASAAAWYARAAGRPGADEDARAMARRFARYLKDSPPSR